MNTTATKAQIAAALAFLGAFLSALLVGWTDTDPLSARDLVSALAAAVVTSGATGFATFQLPNKAKDEEPGFEADAADDELDDSGSFVVDDGRPTL